MKRNLLNNMTENKKIEKDKEILLVVDRIEGNFAVCELRNLQIDDAMKWIKLSEIPFNVCEHDVLCGVYNESGEMKVIRKSSKRLSKIRKIPTKFVRFM